MLTSSRGGIPHSVTVSARFGSSSLDTMVLKVSGYDSTLIQRDAGAFRIKCSAMICDLVFKFFVCLCTFRNIGVSAVFI